MPAKLRADLHYVDFTLRIAGLRNSEEVALPSAQGLHVRPLSIGKELSRLC